MNVFCQVESALPQNGDMAVWNASAMRWEFQAAGGSGQSGYAVGEWKDWHERNAPIGWKERNGGLLTAVSANYPELLAHLERPENAWKLKTEAEWQALRQTAGGVGGAWFYVLDKAADTIRLPDTRGDFSRSAGGMKGDGANDGVYGVGEWHGDTIRNIEGEIWNQGSPSAPTVGFVWSGTGDFGQGNGALTPSQREGCAVAQFRTDNAGRGIAFDASRTVPTAHENRPRAGMLLGCVYVGR